jgi:tetratricopeptide (TPR) repeat protein
MPRLVRTLAAALALPALPAMVGCASPSSTASMDEAIADYRQQRYASARSEAEMVATAGPAGDRDEADYLAGLAAYRLGDLDDAEDYLERAAESDDPVTGGYAHAQLGFVHLREEQPWRAANAFTTASETLPEPDAARAARWASHAFERAGDDKAARRWLDRARDLTGQGPGAEDRPSGAFALQVGAFRERDRAERAASDATSIARTAGLGSVRISERADDRSGTLYVVQFGDFETRREANRARTLVGRLDYIVSAAD